MNDRDMERVIARLTPPKIPQKSPEQLAAERRRADEQRETRRAEEARLSVERAASLKQMIASFLVAMAEVDYDGSELIELRYLRPKPRNLLGRKQESDRVTEIVAGWPLGKTEKIDDPYRSTPWYEYDCPSAAIYTWELFLLINGRLAKREDYDTRGKGTGGSYLDDPYYEITGNNGIPPRDFDNPYWRIEWNIPKTLAEIADTNGMDWHLPE